MLTTVIQGDALTRLMALPTNSVHCVVTSVPYWGLRSYLPDGHPDKGFEIGLEQSLDDWAGRLVDVFREVRRVLHPSGTVWLNCGDAYASGNRATFRSCSSDNKGHRVQDGMPRPRTPEGMKEKDLLGMPWLLAFALRKDGWYLRSEIIWHKTNQMPESVLDRPTKCHEQIFLMSESPNYFYDQEAIKEPVTGGAHPRREGVNSRMSVERQPGKENSKPNPSRYSRIPGVGPKSAQRSSGIKANTDFHENVIDLVSARNKRTVWPIATESSGSDTHFATFPRELPKLCILAGTSARGVCPRCLHQWERIVEEGPPDEEWRRRSGADSTGGYSGQSTKDHDAHGIQNASDVKRRILEGMVTKRTIGWQPTCDCGSCSVCGEDAKRGLCEGATVKPLDPIPATVLDPFAGTFTTCEVAMELGRSSIGIELSEEDCEFGRIRLNGVTPGFPNLA